MSRCPTCDSKSDCLEFCGDSLEGIAGQFETLQKENEAMRADLLYFWTWIVGGYESRPETRLNVELEKMEERYEWLKGEMK